MDSRTFDRLTRLFGAAGTRRDATRAIFGTLVGGALLAQDPDAEAGPRQGQGKGGEGGGGGGRGSNAGRGGRPGNQRRRRRRGKKSNGPDNGQGNGGGTDNGGGNATCSPQGQATTAGQACCVDLVEDPAGVCNPPLPASCEATCFGDNVCCNEVCANGNCCSGATHFFCGAGEDCTSNGCACGGGPPCADGEVCDGGICVCAPDRFACGSELCTDCAPPGGSSTQRLRSDSVSAQSVDATCCEPESPSGGYCSCGGADQCCKDTCFQHVINGVYGAEFCCEGSGYLYCEEDGLGGHKNAVCCPCSGDNCDPATACAACLEESSPGRIGSVRRPR